MSRRSLSAIILVLPAAALLASACGPKEYPVADGGLGGSAGGVASSSSSNGGVFPDVCGNGVAEFGEQCDGNDLYGNTCETVGKGFTAGTLSCTKDCLFDTSACKLTESNCFDGFDNDQDGKLDCGDPQCAAQCADSCSGGGLYAVPEPWAGFASLSGHPNKIGASCSAAPLGGPEIVFAVTPQFTGVFEAQVTADLEMTVSARKACSDAASELGCFDRFLFPGAVQRLVVPSVAGEMLYVVVEGHAASAAAGFEMVMGSRPIACGDGHADGSEACDDGNTTSGDGCSATCALEAKETEPNGTTTSANAYASGWVGSIAPAGDVDVVSVAVPKAPATLRAAIADFDGHSCDEGGLEGVIEILAPDGVTVMGSDDAGATNTCPSASTGVFATGTYYVRARASAKALDATFPYRLDVQVTPSVCGNNIIEPGEQCDTGDTIAGDGCSPTCHFELSEIEPNNVTASANAFTNLWYATISPAGDADVVSFDVPTGATQAQVHVTDNGDGDCAAGKIKSKVEILAPDGVTVIGSSQGGCALVLVQNTAQSSPIHAGKYFARVSADPAAPASTFTYELTVDTQ